MARTVVASLLLVSLLLASANGLCVLGLISLPLLCPSPCNLLGLISSQCRQTGVSLTLTGGTIILDANILSLQLSTLGNSLVTVKLGDMNITTDLILNGNVLLSVASGVTAAVGGLLEVSSNAVLDVAGSLIVGGTATINGKLKLSGEHSTNAVQTAWIHAHSLIVSGSIGQPGTIEGNGGVDADVQFSGQTTTGQPFANNSIYISKNVSVTASSTLKVNGNITVEGGSSIFGILHLAGPKLAGNAQAVWYNSLSDAFVVKGSQNKAAKITGNGGITGNVYMGDFGGLSPGNSPGKVSFNGDLLMSTNSFTEIEAESFSANGFDQYIIKNHFYRDGYLYITFLNGFVPTVNNRFNFGAHTSSSGTFHTVMTMDGYEVTAAYSDRSSTFVFSDPVTPAYCTCTSTF